jgi:predicted transcriptional regulator of viral defense system
MMSDLDRVHELVRQRGLVTAAELRAARLSPRYLSLLAARGYLVRQARGVYSLPDYAYTVHHDLALAALRVPRGVVCLLSALSVHGLTTEAPFEVWMALPAGQKPPRPDVLPLRIVHLSGASYTEGQVVYEVEGVSVPVYSAAKTVADCFKFRNKIGLEVALEALQAYIRHNRGSIDTLWHFAGICRVQQVMRPYLAVLG